MRRNDGAVWPQALSFFGLQKLTKRSTVQSMEKKVKYWNSCVQKEQVSFSIMCVDVGIDLSIDRSSNLHVFSFTILFVAGRYCCKNVRYRYCMRQLLAHCY